MDWNPGGSDDPPRSPLSPKAFNALTPTSQKILNNLNLGNDGSNKDYHSLADLTILSREIQSVRAIFTDDLEVLNEAEELSQSISRLIRSNANAPKKSKLELKYSLNDFGPFMVIIESNAVGNIGNIHPMNFAKKLAASNVKGIKNIAKRGKKRISIEFDLPDRANNFVTENPFSGDPAIDVFIPSRMVTSKGIIKNVGSEITKEDIELHAHSKVKILDARQLNRRTVTDGIVSYVPSSTWILTFQGKNLPEKIALWGCLRHVSLYVGPVIQCYNCLRYGHTKANCNNPSKSKRCRNCAENHEEQECPDPSHPKCVFCSGEHASTDRSCPEFLRQKQINRLIAVENISYFEAVKMIPKNYNATSPLLRNDQFSFDLRPQLFPQLPSRLTNSVRDSAVISVHDRRNLLDNGTSTPLSYSTALNKKRKKNPQSPGYDRDLHESQLYNTSLPLSPILGSPSHSQSDQIPSFSGSPLSDELIFEIVSKRLQNKENSEFIKSLSVLFKNNYPSNVLEDSIPIPTVEESI